MNTTNKIILLLLLSINALSFSQTFIGDKVEINKILEKAKKFSKEYIKGDNHAIANLYTENAKLLPSGSEIIYGKKQI